MRSWLTFAICFAFGCTSSNPNFRSTSDPGNTLADLAGVDLTGVPLDLTTPTDDAGELPDLANADLVIVGVPCNNEGGACVLGPDQGGICRNAICTACVDPTDDGACTFAYGGPRLCISGSCISGNCRSSNDCDGKLCLGTSCISCSSTPQCQADPVYGLTSVCNGFDGTCLSLACKVGNDTPTLGCGGNQNSVCCSASLASGSEGTCQDGNCCDDSDCTEGRTCVKIGADDNAVAGVCSSCDAPSGNVYYVDPINGSDTTGTGANGAENCAFRTITKALNALPGAIPAGTKIIVRGDGDETPLASTEVYPITIPGNVSITIADDSGDILVAPTQATAFVMQGKLSRLGGTANNRFIVSGDKTFANEASGVSTLPGCDGTVHHILIRDYDGLSGRGIYVAGGGKLVAGDETEIAANTTGIFVTSTTGGTPQIGNLQANFQNDADREFGLYVHDNKTGIAVTNRGWVWMLANFDDQTLQISANSEANLAINQTGAMAAETNIIAGAHLVGPSARGISLIFGSRLSLRRSRSVGSQYGVYIAPNNFMTGTSPNTSGIDLGKGGDAGGNRFQDEDLPNTKAGLCLATFIDPNAPVAARGNLFRARNCAASNPGMLVTNDANDCQGGVDIGYDDAFTNPGAANLSKAFDIQGCTAN